jgi:protein-tyrosine phosphatase
MSDATSPDAGLTPPADAPRPVGARARAWLGARYRWLRDVPDRIAHRRRHRDAIVAVRAAVARADGAVRLLVVCHGNVCRSPYLEYALRRELGPEAQVRVESAGFVGPGRGVPDASHLAGGGRGVDLAPHVSRLLTRELVATADVALVMSAAQAARLRADFGAPRGAIVVAGDLDPAPIETREVRDPWNKPVGVFHEVFDRLDRCARVLASALAPAHR